MRPQIGEIWRWVMAPNEKTERHYLILGKPNYGGYCTVLAMGSGSIYDVCFAPDSMPYWQKVA